MAPEISIPGKLIIDFRVVFDVAGLPPEKVELFKQRDYKTWAAEVKEELEGDPEMGKFTKVSYHIEEVI